MTRLGGRVGLGKNGVYMEVRAEQKAGQEAEQEAEQDQADQDYVPQEVRQTRRVRPGLTSAVKGRFRKMNYSEKLDLLADMQRQLDNKNKQLQNNQGLFIDTI